MGSVNGFLYLGREENIFTAVVVNLFFFLFFFVFLRMSIVIICLKCFREKGCMQVYCNVKKYCEARRRRK